MHHHKISLCHRLTGWFLRVENSFTGGIFQGSGWTTCTGTHRSRSLHWHSYSGYDLDRSLVLRLPCNHGMLRDNRPSCTCKRRTFGGARQPLSAPWQLQQLLPSSLPRQPSSSLPRQPSSSLLPRQPSSWLLPRQPSSWLLPRQPSSSLLPRQPSSSLLPRQPSSSLRHHTSLPRS